MATCRFVDQPHRAAECTELSWDDSTTCVERLHAIVEYGLVVETVVDLELDGIHVEMNLEGARGALKRAGCVLAVPGGDRRISKLACWDNFSRCSKCTS